MICSIFAILITGCSNEKSKVSISDVLRAQRIVPLLVQLPNELNGEDVVALEIYGEEGVKDSRNIGAVEEGFFAGQIVKIFIHEPSPYTFSVITDNSSRNGIELELGDANLKMYGGKPHIEVHQVDEPLAGFGIDGTTSYMNPRGDDLSLRLTIKSKSEQSSGGDG